MTLANTCISFINANKHRVAIFKFVVERLYMHEGVHEGVHSKLKKCPYGLYIVKYNVLVGSPLLIGLETLLAYVVDCCLAFFMSKHCLSLWPWL